MPDHLTASLQAFQTTLSSQERSDLSDMERAAMIAETHDLITKSRKNKGGAMGTSKQAQATPPPVGAPPTGPTPKEGQEVTTEPVAPIPSPPKTAQTPAPVEPPTPATPPVVAQQDEQPPMEAPAEPGGISEYIDEIEETPDGMSSDEMGIEDPTAKAARRQVVAAYVEAYGHLRIRPTTKNALEVYDPKTNKALILVRPNKATRKDAQKLRRCAVEVLSTIAHKGLVKTAQMWKAQMRNASGGIVDYGEQAQTEKPSDNDNSINDRGETNMDQDVTIGVDSTTGDGDNLAAEEKPETREPAGLSGKAAAADVPAKGGILPGHETNMSDGPAKSPEGNSLSSLDHVDDDKQDELPKKDKGSDSSLDDEINTFANESLTAGLRQAQAALPGEQPMPMDQTGGCGSPTAQMEVPPESTMPAQAQGMPGTPPPPPPPMPAQAQPDPDAVAPGMGADVLPEPVPGEEDVMGMSEEQKLARLYRKRAEKQVAENTRNFIARFVRCVRLAARRQALNLEQNHLKIAVADALMSEARLSKHEVYVPMDSRTAAFICERGLDQRNAMIFIDSLIKRSASFMKMSDEALTQVEEDMEAIQPVEPGMMGEEEMGMELEGQPVDPSSPSVMPDMPQMAQEEGICENCQGAGCEMCMGMEAEPPMDMEPPMEEPDAGVMGAPGDMEAARAASTRNRAASGNLPINPGAAQPPAAPGTMSKRDQIRFAVGATKSAALHKHFGGS